MVKQKQTKVFLLGALAGTVAGTVTALLLAPKAGKELRQDIAGGVHDLSEKTVRAVEQASEKTTWAAKQLGDKAVHIADRAKDGAEALISSARTWRKGEPQFTTEAAGEVGQTDFEEAASSSEELASEETAETETAEK
ncbi:Gas vesicle protein [Paenibacillus algorifonticola]|uniref:Gas vesicle protein n=2 Tax=Paenibacillus algorifonticola TaxID=684063 RepID=A0A1I2A157_9BACL|nr:Gas vesicle protein [Paenibacillus algorifonticola]